MLSQNLILIICVMLGIVLVEVVVFELVLVPLLTNLCTACNILYDHLMTAKIIQN